MKALRSIKGGASVAIGEARWRICWVLAIQRAAKDVSDLAIATILDGRDVKQREATRLSNLNEGKKVGPLDGECFGVLRSPQKPVQSLTH